MFVLLIIAIVTALTGFTLVVLHVNHRMANRRAVQSVNESARMRDAWLAHRNA